MSAETASRVFELFAQAERTSDRSSGGLGLGLALVKSLVELHGGTVSCSSQGLNQGNTFSIRLPLALPSSGPSSAEEGVGVLHSDAGGPRRILIVDDNADAAEMLAVLLQSLGHEVRVELTSLGALEKAQQFRPQLCMLDIGLPDMDGNELARQLLALPETASSVLVAVTGYGQASDRAASKAAGFHHHLVKPIDGATLDNILALSRHQGPSSIG